MSAPTCPTIVFEPLQEADLFACYTLCQNTFGECPTFAEVQETFAQCQSDPHYNFLVGKINGQIAAYTSMIFYHNLFDGTSPIVSLWHAHIP